MKTTTTGIRALLTIAAISLSTGCDNKSSNGIWVGQLESDRIEISAEVSEPIVSIDVEEGQTVSAGKLLLQQNQDKIQASILGARAAVGQRQAILDELVRGPRQEQISAARARLKGAEDALSFRQLEYERSEEMFSNHLGSEDARDIAKASLDAARAQVAETSAQLEELLTGTTKEELQQAEQAVEQTKAELQTLLIQAQRHNHYAPVASLVDEILFEPGERPVVGQPILTLLSGKQPYARVYVPEGMRVSIFPGTAVSLEVDGLDQRLQGRVRWVSSEAAFTPYFALTERDRGRLSYLAKIDILNAEEVLPAGSNRLPDGLPVQVYVE